MRWVLAAIFFVIASFIFFFYWAVMTFLVDTVHDALIDDAEALGSPQLNDIFATVPFALGVICAIIFVVIILLHYIMDSLSEEPEYYWR